MKGALSCWNNDASLELLLILVSTVHLYSHLQGCALKLQTVKSHEAMASAMQSTAKAMKSMNKAVNPQTIAKMMAEFERENMKTELMQEIMGDAIDDALGEADNEEEEDKIVNQVLDEIGISFGEELPEAAGLSNPAIGESAAPAKIATPAGGDDPAVSELEARLNNLRR